MSTIAGVIFDMDGVLVDSHPIHARAWRGLMQRLGRTVSDKDLQFILEGRKRDEILTHFLGPLSPQDAQRYGAWKDELMQNGESELKLVAGVAEFLQQLQTSGIAMAVATSASRERTRRTLDRLHLSGSFSVVVTGDDVNVGKPSPDLFLMAAAQVKLSPEFLLVVEDSVSGIEAARTAGMRTLGIGTGPRVAALSGAGAHAVVENFVGLEFARLDSLLGLPKAYEER
jgi:HAD superfamily hydrolase (TIGR01509 family)